jgi:Gas vesicle synthesis protein GvpL/GvpF
MGKHSQTAVLNGVDRERRPPTTRCRKYLYAIVFGDSPIPYGSMGIDGLELQIISEGRVAAVVSDAPGPKIRPERRHLAAHHTVLKQLIASMTPLPTSFGIIADSAGAVRRILSRNQEAFLDQLNRVAGKVEMGLRVTWDVPNIFEYFVNTHAELRAARDRLLSNEQGPTHEGKLEVGRMFDHLLSEDRESYTERVERLLAPACAEFKANKCRSEQEVMNLACLVDRTGQECFAGTVFAAAKVFDNNFAFDYSGPWAPHNFVELDVDS